LGPADRWLPNWRPLPGETLVLTLTRPPGVPGPTLTIDRVDTRVEPGQRGTLSTLTLAIRSSQGGSHVIRLPDAAEPIAFSLDGRSLPLPDTAPEVELPLTPGSTRAELTWREPQPLALGYRPSLPDLRSPAVNLNLSLSLPDDRWVLWTRGPRIGPAVLFWGILLVLIGLAAGLGRSRLTPLRFHDWLLLGVGFILAEVWVVLLVIGWLFALGLRHRLDPLARPAWRFNLIQVGTRDPDALRPCGPPRRRPTGSAGHARDADHGERLDRDHAQLVSGSRRTRVAGGVGALGPHVGLPRTHARLGAVACDAAARLAALGLGGAFEAADLARDAADSSGEPLAGAGAGARAEFEVGRDAPGYLIGSSARRLASV
jgi:hypothetical protein